MHNYPSFLHGFIIHSDENASKSGFINVRIKILLEYFIGILTARNVLLWDYIFVGKYHVGCQLETSFFYKRINIKPTTVKIEIVFEGKYF